jgi:hypothetical protein
MGDYNKITLRPRHSDQTEDQKILEEKQDCRLVSFVITLAPGGTFTAALTPSMVSSRQAVLVLPLM